MKRIAFILALVIVMLWGCARMPVYKSTWQQPVLPDIEAGQEWVKDMNYDLESGIMYGLFNDTENLYVKMKFRNEVLQTKLMVTGLTFWIDTLGKKNKQLGLVFPMEGAGKGLKGQAEMNRPGQQRVTKQQIDTAVFNSRYRKGMQTMKLINYFGEGRVDHMDNLNKEGINAILRMDEENMIYYEAVIALNKIFPDPLRFLNDTTQYFSFGIETGKMEMPSAGNGGGRPQMGGGGSRGGKGMGGMNGGGGPPGDSHGGSGMDSDKMAMMKAMSEKSKVWIKKASLTSEKAKL